MTTEEAADRLTEADVARYWDEIADHWASDVRQGYDVYRTRCAASFPAGDAGRSTRPSSCT